MSDRGTDKTLRLYCLFVDFKSLVLVVAVCLIMEFCEVGLFYFLVLWRAIGL